MINVAYSNLLEYLNFYESLINIKFKFSIKQFCYVPFLDLILE